jgi:hypothetical protein
VTITVEVFHALEKRLSVAEDRLTGGNAAFTEFRSENKEIRGQVAQLREMMIEIVGRDGDGGTMASMHSLADSLNATVDRLDKTISKLAPEVESLIDLKPQVDKVSRLAWRLLVTAALVGSFVGGAVSLAMHFL